MADGRRVSSAVWTWLVPLAGAAAVFGGVLLVTPPGWSALSDVLFGLPRGPNAEAAAYALGAAGSLGLVVLLGLAGLCWLLDGVLRRLVMRR